MPLCKNWRKNKHLSHNTDVLINQQVLGIKHIPAIPYLTLNPTPILTTWVLFHSSTHMVAWIQMCVILLGSWLQRDIPYVSEAGWYLCGMHVQTQFQQLGASLLWLAAVCDHCSLNSDSPHTPCSTQGNLASTAYISVTCFNLIPFRLSCIFSLPVSDTPFNSILK